MCGWVTLTFTGGGRGKDNDSFNTLRGKFVTADLDGSSSLFDGHSLHGWQGGAEGWTAEDGKLVYNALRKGKDSDGREHPGLKRDKGHIGLLGHTQGAEFRNIRIKELRSAQ